MLSSREAQEIILRESKPIGEEEVPVLKALGSHLSSPISAPIDLPPFDHAAMDGYAVRSDDLRKASPEKSVTLKVIGTVTAGDALTRNLFSTSGNSPLPLAGEGQGVRERGQAIRIMTGAPLPEGMDAVVPFEETSPPSSPSPAFTKPVSPGSNIRRAGEDVRRGTRILEVGERITSRTIALLAALGLSKVAVFRRPIVALVVTGDEIVSLGEPLGPGKIYNSNGPALEAALHEMGLNANWTFTVPDEPSQLKMAAEKGLRADVLITVGAVSAGDRDYLPQVFEELGVRKLFHKVAIKPGKPLYFGTFGRRLVFGLPGNPVSSLMVFDRFVRPALLKIEGCNPFRQRREGVLEEGIKGTEGKEDYLRGIVRSHEGRYLARSAGPQGSASLLPLARANATLILSPNRREAGKGETVPFEFFEEVL